MTSHRHHPPLNRHIPLLAAWALILPACPGGDIDESQPPSTASPLSQSPTPSPTPAPTSAPRQVEILIDTFGIPHIYASSDTDLFFAAGYQMASDRLYQMEGLRRFALGRSAEILGSDALVLDVLSRGFSIKGWGQKNCEAMEGSDPEGAALLKAWVGGINHFVGEVNAGDAPLPFGFGPEHLDFQPEAWDWRDSCVILEGAGYALDMTLQFELALAFLYGLYPEAMEAIEVLKPALPVYSLPPEERPKAGLPPAPSSPTAQGTSPLIALLESGRITPQGLIKGIQAFQRLKAANGSNNWAVDGRFTDTGRPMLAGDPHLSFSFFGAPYPLHLNSKEGGGSFDVGGFAFPGTPGIAIGFNDSLIWSPTSAFGDVMDLWVVEEEEGRAKMGDTWVDIRTWEEGIIVRAEGGPAGEGETAVTTFAEVPGYGPLIPGMPFGETGYLPIINGWTGFKVRPVRWFMALNRAGTLDEFEATVASMGEMNYNFLAADKTGIALKVGIQVPKRADVSGARAPWLLMNASDPGSLWGDDFLSESQLPASRGADRGWLGTANNDPFGFTDDGRLDTDPYYYGSLFAPGYRAGRIESELTRLTDAGPISLEDMLELQTDTHSTMADHLIPLLSAAYNQIGQDPDLESFQGNQDLSDLVALLGRWNRKMDREEAGALAFHSFLHDVTAKTLRDDIPLAYDLALALQTIYVLKIPDIALRGGYPLGDGVLQGGEAFIILDAAAQTAAWLRQRFRRIDDAAFSWGDIKVTRFDEAYGYDIPLFDVPTDGGEDTLDVSQNIATGKTLEVWESHYVPVERMVGTFDEGGRPRAYVTFPLGAFADPESADSIAANASYVEGQHIEFPFSKEAVEAATRERRVLVIPEEE